MQIEMKTNPSRKLSKFLWVRDIAHLIKFTWEDLGGDLPQEVYDYAQDAINKWKELLYEGETRLVIESLPYFSDSVNLITRGNGINFSINMNAGKLNGGVPLDSNVITGMFDNKQTIEDLTNHILEVRTLRLEDKYY